MIVLQLEGWQAKYRNPETGALHIRPIAFAVFDGVMTQQGYASTLVIFVEHDGILTQVPKAEVIRVSDA